MKTKLKQSVKKVLSFMLAVAMVITSFTLPSMTVKAEEAGKELTLYLKLPDGSTADDWVFNYWQTESAELIEKGDDQAVGGTWGADKKFPKLLAGDEGWGYVKLKVTGSLEGCQLIRWIKDSTDTTTAPVFYSCWDSEITSQNLDAAYYDTTSGKWYKDAALKETVSIDTGIDNPDATTMKVYYYVPADKNVADYGVNAWGGATPTEAGPKMMVTAWNQQFSSLKETGKENTIEGLEGKWGYIGFDSNSIDGLQFVTADGGADVWISTIKTLGYKAVYYVPGYGWYTNEKASGDPIPAPVFHDNLYIVGAGDALGNWTLGNAVAMTKTEDTYSVTIPMKAGTYEFTPIHDPATFAWTYQYKDADNSYKNYTVTLEDDRDVTFIVTNVDTAKVTADVAALKNYKVTFKNGDAVLSTQTVLEGQAATAPAAPAKTGYTFDGWDASFDAVTADLTVNAKWKANEAKPVTPAVKSYKVVFKNGKTVVSKQTITKGKAAKAPKLTKKGYTLSWDKSFNKVTADLTVNAKWKANKYTVSYNVNGGKKLKTTSKSVTYGKTYGKLAAPQRAGYTFAGWYTAKTKGTKITAGSKVAITKKTTLYARWSKVTKPGKVAKPSLKNSSAKAMKVSYKKVKGAAGYEIRYSTKSNMKSAKKVTTKSTSTTIKKLTKGKKYYVQVRAYKLDSTGKKIYSKAQSSKVSLKIKK